MIDNLLERFNLKYEDLNAVERETINSWIEALEKSRVTTTKIKEYISAMRSGVEQELTKTSNNNKQDLFLKARLRNYMLIEAFLTTPERAKEQLEKALSGIASPLDKRK